jgi:isoquinoline 1-oxidoreductase beta subunit
MEYTPVKCAVPVGWWRSVEDSINAFAIESFLDELAAAAQRDPVQYRLSLLREARRIPGRDGAVIETSRLARVLIEVAAQSGWDGKQRGGRSLGIACHTCRGSYIAVVVEISICSGVLTVSRVWAAVDCGFAVNPKGLESQIEGGLLFGTSAALYEAVTLTSGKVTQTNFADYRVLRMSESPLTEVKIIKSAAPPTGAGEIAVPLVAPAIANAVFGLTGHRPRRLPMRVSYGPSSEVTATCIGLSSDV